MSVRGALISGALAIRIGVVCRPAQYRRGLLPGLMGVGTAVRGSGLAGHTVGS